MKLGSEESFGPAERKSAIPCCEVEMINWPPTTSW